MDAERRYAGKAHAKLVLQETYSIIRVCASPNWPECDVANVLETRLKTTPDTLMTMASFALPTFRVASPFGTTSMTFVSDCPSGPSIASDVLFRVAGEDATTVVWFLEAIFAVEDVSGRSCLRLSADLTTEIGWSEELEDSRINAFIWGSHAAGAASSRRYSNVKSRA